jgi:hypothetical protein
MGHTRDETTRPLAERWCWEGARRDDARVARPLYRTQVVDGVCRRDEGAWLDACLHFLQAIGGMAVWEHACGTALPHERRPFRQDVWRDGLQPLLGMERLKARPSLLCRDEALMPWGASRPSRSAPACASAGPPRGRPSASQG